MSKLFDDFEKINTDIRVIKAKNALKEAKNALEEAKNASREAYLNHLSMVEIFEIEEREIHAHCVVHDAEIIYETILSLVIDEINKN